MINKDIVFINFYSVYIFFTSPFIGIYMYMYMCQYSILICFTIQYIFIYLHSKLFFDDCMLFARASNPYLHWYLQLRSDSDTFLICSLNWFPCVKISVYLEGSIGWPLQQIRSGPLDHCLVNLLLILSMPFTVHVMLIFSFMRSISGWKSSVTKIVENGNSSK